jgi:predicted phosphodiesterase
MNIQYISDIHLEEKSFKQLMQIINAINPIADVLVLAGDIGYPHLPSYKIFLEAMNTKFLRVYLVAGNHEFYKTKCSIEEIYRMIEDLTNNTTMTNVRFLQNSCDVYKGYRFIGTTLWSTIKNHNHAINETKFMNGLTVAKYNQLNKTCINFLENTLNNLDDDNIKNVVITHYLPSYDFVTLHYRIKCGDSNEWFYCDLDDLIEKYKNKLECWIYGHTHTPSIKIKSDVTFVCNPVGYNGENDVIDYNKHITL